MGCKRDEDRVVQIELWVASERESRRKRKAKGKKVDESGGGEGGVDKY